MDMRRVGVAADVVSFSFCMWLLYGTEELEFYYDHLKDDVGKGGVLAGETSWRAGHMRLSSNTLGLKG